MRVLGQWSTNIFKLAVFKMSELTFLLDHSLQFSEGKVDST